NAGMPLPILVRQGQARPIRVEGVPLGLLDHTGYQETAVNLEKGDVFAMFSDGLLEAANPQQEEFGSRRLEKILREHAERPGEEILEAVFTEISRFERGRPRRDDQTLLVIKVQ
ncbi:MAG: serine/threonine-protein phosphatase, partial [Acidobacteria bacterium]|nr:serine/threonine-protein phosphatase [Acidobacteriota bacterium]